jgi:hypothetical protein
MPPRASHRLSILILPGGEAASVPAHAVAREVCGEALRSGLPAPSGHDEPAPRFLSNEQGGFRVRCPATGEPAARPFGAALQRWREGGPRQAACPCGASHDLADFDLAPPAGFAASWLEFRDVGFPDLPEILAAALAAAWPGFRVVLRRDS